MQRVFPLEVGGATKQHPLKQSGRSTSCPCRKLRAALYRSIWGRAEWPGDAITHTRPRDPPRTQPFRGTISQRPEKQDGVRSATNYEQEELAEYCPSRLWLHVSLYCLPDVSICTGMCCPLHEYGTNTLLCFRRSQSTAFYPQNVKATQLTAAAPILMWESHPHIPINQ